MWIVRVWPWPWRQAVLRPLLQRLWETPEAQHYAGADCSSHGSAQWWTSCPGKNSFSLKSVFIIGRKRSLGQGNVFTHVPFCSKRRGLAWKGWKPLSCGIPFSWTICLPWMKIGFCLFSNCTKAMNTIILLILLICVVNLRKRSSKSSFYILFTIHRTTDLDHWLCATELWSISRLKWSMSRSEKRSGTWLSMNSSCCHRNHCLKNKSVTTTTVAKGELWRHLQDRSNIKIWRHHMVLAMVLPLKDFQSYWCSL